LRIQSLETESHEHAKKLGDLAAELEDGKERIRTLEKEGSDKQEAYRLLKTQFKDEQAGHQRANTEVVKLATKIQQNLLWRQLAYHRIVNLETCLDQAEDRACKQTSSAEEKVEGLKKQYSLCYEIALHRIRALEENVDSNYAMLDYMDSVVNDREDNFNELEVFSWESR
jgi:predicted  nucleic acid-binding Zn-ribbon protein